MIPFALGLIAWTVFEYLVHRRIGHGGRRAPFQAFRAQHLRHHVEPSWHPPWFEVAIGALGTLVLATAVGSVFTGLFIGLTYGIGVAVGFLSYEGLHRLVHADVSLPPPLSWIRMHHLAHHDHPRTRYGITVTLWDHLLGTDGRHPRSEP